MRRSLFALSSAFLLWGATATAQEISVVETAAMRKAATAQTTAVNRKVKLSPEQKQTLDAHYLRMEKLKDAMRQRHALANYSEEDLAAANVPFQATLLREERRVLEEVLTPEQYARWSGE